MLFKNTGSQKAYVFAYNKTTGSATTGDASNITATISKDGAATAATNDTNPTEIGGGVYAFDLTQAETNCDTLAIIAASATSNVVLAPLIAYTTGGSIPQAGVLAAASYSAPDSAATIAAAVWAAATRTLTAISDSAGVTTLLARLTSGRAGNLDNLDTTVSSRMETFSYFEAPTAQEIADEVLTRDWTEVTGVASRSVLNALRALRNRVTRSGATLTVYREDDSTTAYTAALTTDAGAEPVTSVDPS